MDKNTATGLILIFILMAGWFYFTLPSGEEIARQQQERAIRDSLAAIENLREGNIQTEDSAPLRDIPSITEQDRVASPLGFFAGFSQEDTLFTTIETPHYKAIFSNVGAGPVSFELKEYKNWDGSAVQMIRDTTASAYSLGFLSTENYNIDTRKLLFTPEFYRPNISLAEGEQAELSYRLEMEEGTAMVIAYTFNGENFDFDIMVNVSPISGRVVANSVDFGWVSPLNFTELDRTQDGLMASSYIYAGGELEQFKLEKPGAQDYTINGNIDWVASRTKFFAQIIKPVTQSSAAIVDGFQTGASDDPLADHAYRAALQSSIPADGILTYRVYVGPLKYDAIKSFDSHAFDLVEVGYSWIRWFSDPFVRFLVIPFFTFMGSVVPNYGISIIIFAFLVKLLLAPLTYKSFKSMAAMKDLQPQMQELQAKYKDNPQKQQQEVLKLYKKAKVNPLGGCLPNLLQFPILITLWRFFQNSILIRQESFLWANDLSAPDYILSLPFAIPFLGPNIAGFVLLMTASMVAQTKLTGGMSSGSAATNAQMKIFQYMLPVMLLFFFNNFASGLSLYYLVFNVLSIGQQMYINKSSAKK